MSDRSRSRTRGSEGTTCHAFRPSRHFLATPGAPWLTTMQRTRAACFVMVLVLVSLGCAAAGRSAADSGRVCPDRSATIVVSEAEKELQRGMTLREVRHDRTRWMAAGHVCGRRRVVFRLRGWWFLARQGQPGCQAWVMRGRRVGSRAISALTNWCNSCVFSSAQVGSSKRLCSSSGSACRSNSSPQG